MHYGDDRLEVPVWGLAVSPLRITSSDGSPSFDFGNVLIGRPDTMDAVVENIGAAPVAVTEVHSPRAEVEVLGGSMVVGGRTSAVFRVVLTPLEKGVISDSLEVTTSVNKLPLRMGVRADVTTGVHALEIDLGDLSGGVYVCRMEAGGFTQTRRMVLF